MKLSELPSVMGFIGLISSVVGSILYACVPYIVQRIISNSFVLDKGTEVYSNWIHPPIPINISIYLFNVTNPYEVQASKELPKLEEIGPFVYREMRVKEIFDSDDKDTITYAEEKSFIFQPNISASLDEEVTAINVPLVAAATIVDRMANNSHFENVIRVMANTYIVKRNETLFTVKRARELLFEGYYVNMVEDLVRLGRTFRFQIPEMLPNNTFGLFYRKNNTADGLFTVYTGKSDVKRFTIIKKWNEYEKLPYWGNSLCGMINGTDGFQFPPFVSHNNRLYVFSPDVCRSIYFEYEQDVEVEGIPALRFVIPDSLFVAPHEDPDNACFCLDEADCDVNGVLDLSSCQNGAPIVSSAPHFYQAEEAIRTSFEGLKLNEEVHKSFLDVEPMTGIVLRGARRVQVNIKLRPIKGIEPLENVKEMTFPIMWLDKGATINESYAMELKGRIHKPIQYTNVLLISVISSGIIFFVVGVACSIYRTQNELFRRKSESTEYLHRR